MLRLLTWSLAFVLAAPIYAADSATSAKVIRAGIYEMEGGAEGPWKVKGVRETTDIHGVIGLRFGIDFELCGLNVASATVTATMSHPEITRPDGTKVITQSAEMGPFPVSGGCIKSGYGYTFDHTYELVAGKWVIKIMYNGNQVVDKTFNVTIGV